MIDVMADGKSSDLAAAVLANWGVGNSILSVCYWMRGLADVGGRGQGPVTGSGIWWLEVEPEQRIS